MLKKLLELLRDTLVYGVGSVLGQLIGFFLLPLYTARLSPADYGLLAMVTIASALFSAFAFVGMKSAIFRYYNLTSDEDQRAVAVGTGFLVVVVATLTLLVPSLLGARAMGEALFGEAGHHGLLQVAMLSAAANTVGDVPLLVLQAARRPRTSTTLNLAKTLLSVGLTVWLVVGQERGVWGVVIGAFLAEIAFMIVHIAVTWRYYRFAWDRALLRRMLSYGLPFLPSRLLGMGTLYLSTYMVRKLMGLDDAGLYSVANRFAVPIGFIVGALTQAWWPYRFKIFAEDANPAAFFRTTVTYYVAVIGYLWVGVSFWGPEAVRWLTHERFFAAASIVPAVALIPVMQGFYQMLGTGIEIGEDTRAVPLASLCGLVVVAAGTALLIPALGALGAALAATLGWISMAAAVYVLAQRRYRIEYDWRTMIALGALAGVSVATALLAQRLPATQRLSVALLVSVLYPLAAFAVLQRSHVEQERMQILRQRLSSLLRGRHSA
jgi:O-antigen/teichoic acid export membrane protein